MAHDAGERFDETGRVQCGLYEFQFRGARLILADDRNASAETQTKPHAVFESAGGISGVPWQPVRFVWIHHAIDGGSRQRMDQAKLMLADGELVA